MSAPLPKWMMGWAIRAYGENPELIELEVPEPGPLDVLIHMRSAEVGDWDDLVRTGEWPMERPFPLVLGLAGAGTVAAVGNEVGAVGVGNFVYTYSYPLYDNGAWAQYMRVPQGYVAHAPRAIPAVFAGAAPIAALTAHETLLEVLELQKGDVVLITAASGGVGHLAVQIAKHVGAAVVATTGTKDLAFVAGLGADVVFDYRQGDVVKRIRDAYPNGIRKALNGVADTAAANAYLDAMDNGGTVVDLPGAIDTSRTGVKVIGDYVVHGDAERLAAVTALFDRRHLRLEVEEMFEFDEAPQALARVLQKHVRGKIALKVR
jgi:NADPH:quinone reductase-like Zn-dependent oxidoreductase